MVQDIQVPPIMQLLGPLTGEQAHMAFTRTSIDSSDY
jgi:hypothetical protein